MATECSLSACAGHLPSGRRSFRKQRTVNPLMVPARYNFLYSSSRPATGVPASPSLQVIWHRQRWTRLCSLFIADPATRHCQWSFAR